MRQFAAISFLLFCLLGGGRRAFCQPPFRFLTISEKEGLPVRNLFGVATTEDGMCWLASLYGLVKFDGETFEVLSHNPLDSASVTFGRLVLVKKSAASPGVLWLGSVTGGLCRFDSKTGRASTFLHDPEAPGSIGGNFTAGILEDKNGGVWVGTDNFTLNYLPLRRSPESFGPGSRRFQRFQPPLPAGILSAKEAGLLGEIVPDVFDKNRLWIGSRFGIYSFDIASGAFRLHPFAEPFPYFYEPAPFPLWMDETGMIWTNRPSLGLLRLDPRSRLWKSWKTDSPGFNRNWLNQIFPLDDSLLLCLSKSDGLWLFNRRTSKLTVLDPANTPGLPAADLVSAFKNEDGDLWLATSAGLVRMTRQPQPVNHFFFPAHFPALQKNNWQRAYALSPDRRRLFMGTYRGDGLLVFDWKNKAMDFVRYRSTPDPTGWDVWMDDLCFDSGGRLWIGSEEGLLRFDEGRRRIFQVFPAGKDSLALQGRHVASLAAGADGKLWLGTLDAGLFCLEPANRRLLPFPAQGGSLSLLKSERIKKVFLDKGGILWIGTETQLHRYLPEKQQFMPPLTGRGSAEISPKNVSDIKQDAAGNVWIATFGTGLFRFDPHTEALDWFNNSEMPGANLIYELALAEGELSRELGSDLWMGTEAGMTNFQPGSQVFANFSEKHGVNAVMKGALIQLPDGMMLNGGSRGFHFFQPNAWREGNRPPLPYLNSLLLFGKKMPLRRGAGTDAAIDLQHGQDHFSIEFSAINSNLYPQTTFAYQMSGQDDDWVEAGSRRFASYTNLPPGKHAFYLKAADKHGNWSEPVRLLDVTVHPAFYQTLWFKMLAAALALGLVFAIYRWRVRQIRRQERWKTELDRQLAEVEMQALRAQMNPHFLHNSLNAINWFVLENQPKQASKYLVKFSRLMRLVLDNSRLKKISLAQELAALRLYVEMEQIRFEPAFEFSLEIAEDLDPDELEIPPLLLQPYVENAIWHGLMNKKGAPGRLHVRLWQSESCLFCSIEDNGIGREAAARINANYLAASPSQGMEITAQRLALLQRLDSAAATVAVFDLKNERGEAAGTRVELRVAV